VEPGSPKAGRGRGRGRGQALKQEVAEDDPPEKPSSEELVSGAEPAAVEPVKQVTLRVHSHAELLLACFVMEQPTFGDLGRQCVRFEWIFHLQEPAEQKGGHATAPQQTADTSSAPGDSGQSAQPGVGALPPLPAGLPLAATAAPVVEEDDYDAFD